MLQFAGSFFYFRVVSFEYLYEVSKATLNTQGKLLYRTVDKCVEKMQSEFDVIDANSLASIAKHINVMLPGLIRNWKEEKGFVNVY